jgi:predicted O-methyltransferase YrrM
LALSRVEPVRCDVTALRPDIDLDRVLSADHGLEIWTRVERRIEASGLTHNPGGIGPAERRALSALVAYLDPAAVLEVGTHIGSSTLTLAATLCHTGNSGSSITTVDVVDVNASHARRWEQFGSRRSPAELVRGEAPVEFVVGRSVEFLANTSERYDFIFLDGDHSAATVYRELPLALARLRRGGVVLLHDYFPNGRPLPQGRIIHGPWLGTRRLIQEGAEMRVVPLGRLPWPTMLGSSVTSLALVLATAGTGTA